MSVAASRKVTSLGPARVAAIGSSKARPILIVDDTSLLVELGAEDFRQPPCLAVSRHVAR
jgi:hypothetical protein